MKYLKDALPFLNQRQSCGITCPKGIHGFFNQECIAGECFNPNCSPDNKKYTEGDFDIPDRVHYHQFVLEVYEYTNKSGLKKEGKCTVPKTFLSPLKF